MSLPLRRLFLSGYGAPLPPTAFEEDLVEPGLQLYSMAESQQNLRREETGREETPFKHTFQDNIIKGTRRIIRNMSESQKYAKAKAHILDALNYRHPRYESESLDTPYVFALLYRFQMSQTWSWFLFLAGYAYLCLVVLDSKDYAAKIATEGTLLFFFFLDTVIQIYLKRHDQVKGESRYSNFFYFRCAILLLMLADLIIFIALPAYDSRPIRPFRILRCFVPLFFDFEMKKSLLSLAAAYKDVLVYFIFFATIIVGYALLGNRALTFDVEFRDSQFPQNVDPFKTNADDLVTMIFIVYVTATYDSYPDNQTLAIQNFEPNYIYFIIFIFMNMFLFSSIPGSLIYLKFRDRRSQILVADEIRQQHSLILAFVTLAEDQSNLHIDHLIKFMLYLYRYKIRFIEHITDICLKLDNNNNRSIQVNEFMQLSKIILENEMMVPPEFDDIPQWVRLREFLNHRLKLKQIVKHWGFELAVSIIIVLSFINAIYFMFSYTKLIETFDNIFVWIFCAELIIRIVAIGPENFFAERWNNVDTFLVVMGIIFFFVPNNNNADGIVRMSRLFRLASLLRLVSHSNFLKDVKFQIWSKFVNIYSILLEIMPIILRFMPLFVFFFYIYAIVGMEIFYNFYDTLGVPNYNQYQQFGDFKSFVHAQYVMVQVLTEAGWSQIAYDHSWRAPQYFVYIMLYFCFLHITIVYILATLIKGIFWEVFLTVNGIFEERDRFTKDEEAKELEMDRKSEEINGINSSIKNNEPILPNTILRRELIENKFDEQIFVKLKKAIETQGLSSKNIKSSKKSIVTQKIINDWEINLEELELSQEVRKKYSKKSGSSSDSETKKINLKEIEERDEEDFESEISELLGKLIIHPKVKYNQMHANPKPFLDFLKSKFKNPMELSRENYFDLHENPLYNQESMFYLVYEINALLGIETSKREQKAMIINNMVQDNIISEDQGERLVKKKLQEKVFRVDTAGVLRKLFISGINEELVSKFETEYFSQIFGYSFKHINKITLEPLLKLQATITYSLRTLLRYPQIDNTEFFQMLTTIEDKISNRLLQRGSLFKFIYKLDTKEDIWFSIEYKKQQEMKVHFLKSGIWCYYEGMQEKEVLYARDMFNWDMPEEDRKACEIYIKRFYHNFESLAFSLLKEDFFFKSNPKTHIYDLYIQHLDVEKTKRFKSHKLQISKIMVVILSKEEERSDMGLEKLEYELSDIKNHEGSKKKKYGFKFDFGETSEETFVNLKNVGAVDDEKIVESEGLPFSFMVDLMREISDVISIYGENFVYHIQRVLNEEFQEINSQYRHNYIDLLQENLYKTKEKEER